MNDDIDLKYLHDRLSQISFTPYPWVGEDRNLGAFRSKEELIEWYCQPPGIENQPYRDRAFYCRELAMLSRIVQPNNIVEFGTSLGIGTCLLRWLNPLADLTTVDITEQTFMPGDLRVETGYLAKLQRFQCRYVQGDSWKYISERGVDLCFIDADHSYEPVLKDSYRAWNNRNPFGQWAIVWHDYNSRHPGVIQAVTEFCNDNKLSLQSRLDSDTVWVIGTKEN